MTAPNLALIILDTVRKDVFDDRAARLRERSDVSYERCYAPSSWTVPSHASMLTGDLLHRHGVHAHNPSYGDLRTEHTFLADLSEYRSVGVSTNNYLSERYGFDRFFDEFEHLHGNEELLTGGIDSTAFMDETEFTGLRRYLAYIRKAREESALLPSLVNAGYMKLNNAPLETPLPRVGDYGARTALRRARRLTTTGDEPFFLFVNLVDAHQPHEARFGYDGPVPNSWTSRQHDIWELNNRPVDEFKGYLDNFRDLYADSVAYLDQRVATFIERLQAASDRPTRIVVTSDHGEALGYPRDRGVGHKLLSTPVTHVPLELFSSPTGTTETVEYLVSLLDVGSLLIGLSNGSLTDLSRPWCPAEQIGAIHPPDDRREFWDRGIRAVHDAPDRKYEWDTLGERDRYETSVSAETHSASSVDIPVACRDMYDAGLTEYKDRVSAEDAQESINAGTQQRLKDLGYM